MFIEIVIVFFNFVFVKLSDNGGYFIGLCNECFFLRLRIEFLGIKNKMYILCILNYWM